MPATDTRTLLLASILTAGCTIVEVRDAETGSAAQGVTVRIDTPSWGCNGFLCGQSVEATTPASGLVVFTPADPADITGPLDPTQSAGNGWKRFELSGPTIDTLVEYRDHQYTQECAAFADGEVTTAPCRTQSFEVHWSGDDEYELLPDLVPVPLASEDDLSWECVSLDEGGTQVDVRILRIAAGAFNGGPGPLELYAAPDDSAWQRVFRRDFSYEDVDTGGCIAWHPLHQHEHFGAWIALRLLDTDPACEGDDYPGWCILAEQNKLSYEPRDTELYDSALNSTWCLEYAEDPFLCAAQSYPGLSFAGGGTSVDGMSPGFGDVYNSDFDSQFIRLDASILPGTYTVEIEVNPDHQIRERSFDNNRHRFTIEVPEPSSTCIDCTNLAVGGCPQYGLEDFGLCE